MNKIIIMLIGGLSLPGCVGLEPVPMNIAERNFQYDYKVPGVGRTELFTRARDQFASVFRDSRSVLRVVDKEEGKIIGKGVMSWVFAPIGLSGITCHSNYELRFKAKDEKARLQLEILRGVPIFSECKGFPLPNKEGYQEIAHKFTSISEEIKKALKQKSSVDDF